MMMKKIKIYACLALFMMLAACNDYLDLSPENELIKDKFWSKSEDVYSALASTYNSFRNSAEESFIWGELRGDMLTINSGGYSDIRQSVIVPTNWRINWNKYYETINLANTLMFYSKEVLSKDQSFTPRMKDAADAEALFIRSMCYFYLVRLWKDVPLVLSPSTSDTVNIYPARSKEHEVIAQIISDLLIAKDKAYTTEYMSNPPYYKGRANKFSIMALLADVYLWNEQYQKSIDYCDSITNSGLFALESSDNWFTIYYPGNAMNESIFEIQYNANLKQNNYFIDEFSGLGLSGSVKFPSGDMRRIGLKKYRYLDKAGLAQRTAAQKDAHIIYYRYADIVLMKAEALNELGRFIEANELYKQTMSRLGLDLPDNIIDQADLRKAILDERAREFVGEGKRWFDLLRAAKRNKFQNIKMLSEHMLSAMRPEQMAVLKSNLTDSNFMYLPVPDRDVKNNPNLKQTPVYDR